MSYAIPKEDDDNDNGGEILDGTGQIMRRIAPCHFKTRVTWCVVACDYLNSGGSRIWEGGTMEGVAIGGAE